MKFNICLIQPTGYIHTLALLEAAEYVLHKIKALGHEVQIVKNRIYPTGINIIFGAHINPENNLNLPKNTIIFNTEQLSENSDWTNSEYLKILNKGFVWDYSNTNLKLIPHLKKCLVNFYFEEKLKRIAFQQNKNYDLAFYGSINDRRTRIIDTLISKGLKIKTILGLYSKERDDSIKDCRAVLNLHYYESQIFQQIRAFYPLINGIPVISEKFPRESAPELYGDVLFIPNNEEFCDFVVRTLKDTKSFEDLARFKLSIYEKTKINNEFHIALNKTIEYFQNNKLLENTKLLFNRINLGSGKDYKRGYLNVDIRKEVLPDILYDLSEDITFPISVNSDHYGLIKLGEGQFDEILANDVLEHVPNLESMMGNCLKLLKVGGKFVINVPFELSYGAWQDPTHIRAFNQNSWLYYTDWFWYLGWFDHKFTLSELHYTLSKYGQELLNQKVNEQVLLVTPRAIDAMKVILTKTETTPEERSSARAYMNNIYINS